MLFSFSIFLISCNWAKKTVSKIPIPISLFRSPIYMDLAFYINGPINKDEKIKLVSLSEEISNINTRNGYDDFFKKSSPPDFDSLEDLCHKKSIVLVALSGGGARAAALSAHSMAFFEKYFNNSVPDERKSLIDSIDVFSSVSGGSMYAFAAARLNDTINKSNNLTENDKKHLKRNFFHILDKTSDVKHTGLYSSAWYLSPFNLLVGPLLTLFSSASYLHVLAGGINYLNEIDQADFIYSNKDDGLEWYKNAIAPWHYKLGDLEKRPRFLFNASLLETGKQFTFTQTPINLKVNSLHTQSARLDLEILHDVNNNDISNILKPLQATTLEEINSSAKSTPLPFAVMASAAFPIFIEPMEIIKYGIDPVSQDIYRTEDRLHLSDGGIWDNSGLTSLMDIVRYLKINKPYLATGESNKLEVEGDKYCKTNNIIVLAINAEIDSYDSEHATDYSDIESLYDQSRVKFGFPFRWRALGIPAIELMHYTNKRRGEYDAISKLHDIDIEVCQNKSTEEKGKGNIIFFPVNLAQLSDFDRYKLEDKHNLFGRLNDISTDYQISEDDDLVLKQATEVIFQTPQKRWNCLDDDDHAENIIRMDKAFSKASSMFLSD